MLMKLLLFLLITPVFAADITCPKESMPIEFTSPVTKNKKVTCGYMKDGKLIKHGFENEYKPDGTLVKSEYFIEGGIAEKPSATEPAKVAAPPTKPVELEVIETKGPDAPAGGFGNFNFNPDMED